MEAVAAGKPAFPRKWVRKAECEDARSCDSFRALTFNLLADGLASDFVKVEPEVLRWSTRGVLLLRSITSHDADIVALQECDRYTELFEPELKKRGYDSVFFSKRQSPCLPFSEDGCALFWKTSKFSLVKSHMLCYVGKDGHEYNQVCQICLLKHIATGQVIAVGNTHLKAWKTEEGEAIRHIQAKLFLEELEKACEGKNYPSIVMGDMNSKPDGKVYPTFAASPKGFETAHALLGMDLPYTSWKIREAGERKYPIDYVLVSQSDGQLEAVAALDVPAPECIPASRLPCDRHGSDHIELPVDIRIKPAKAAVVEG